METTAATITSTVTRSPHRAVRKAFLLEHVPYAALINGYFVPLLVLVIVVCNLLVCVVLVRPNMRTATNAVLVAIAFSDLLTGLWPLPVYIRFFAAGAKDDWVPYSWCYAYFCLTDYLPTVFHTTSIWLTVLLAGQRYVCVCRGDLPRSGAAQRRSVVVKVGPGCRYLPAASFAAAADYILSLSVCLWAVKFCKQDIQKANLRIFGKCNRHSLHSAYSESFQATGGLRGG